MNKYLFLGTMTCLALGLTACNDFLEREPDTIVTDEQLFSTESMVKSALANFYGRVSWGQVFTDEGSSYGMLDEACFGGDVNTATGYDTDLWGVYPYVLIRDMNKFLRGVRQASSLMENNKLQYEAEVRMLRAWAYFNMARCYGGMPIVGDEVFQYENDADVEKMQIARSTEAQIYDYIIAECDFAASHLDDVPSNNIHAARANKWVVLTLKLKAALYAGSLAKYNNLVTPMIKTEGAEVGIPAELADHYYEIALKTGREIINSKRYSLYNLEPQDKAHNFYMATASKDNNPEVIWAQDFVAPDHTHTWSQKACPKTISLAATENRCTPLLNLVEAFEYVDNRDGTLKDVDQNGDYIFYDHPGDIFKGKDPRLKGTIICNGDYFNGKYIGYQAGIMTYQSGKWRTRTGTLGQVDADGDTVTSVNGPQVNMSWFSNKTGFNFRKYLDEDQNGLSAAHGSEIWFVRFRYADVLLMAAEAAMELGQQDDAVAWVNQVRARAGLAGLEQVTLDDIEQERRVEFALENSRWWDLRRWRRAHLVWDGSDSGLQWALFPYKVKDARRPQNGKWAYVRQKTSMLRYSRVFEYKNYYNFIHDDWVVNNPKYVKNPYQ